MRFWVLPSTQSLIRLRATSWLVRKSTGSSGAPARAEQPVREGDVERLGVLEQVDHLA